MTVRRNSSARPGASERSHLAADALIAIARKELSAPERRAAERHLAGCRACSGRARAAAVVAGAGAATAFLAAVPNTARARALRLFEEWHRGRAGGRAGAMASTGNRLRAAAHAAYGRLRRIALPGPATGGWTGGWAPVAVGFRGAAAPATCSWLEGGGYRIELEWMPVGSAGQLRGRVIAAEVTPVEGPASDPAPEPASAPEPTPAPRLVLEFENAPARRVNLGARGFFGPLPATSSRLRVVLETAPRPYRSGWIPLPGSGPSKS